VTRAGALVLLALIAACSSDPEPPPDSGPYVVTAIDYHFHDAHPSLPIALDRPVEVKNQGSNIHNVTFEDADFNENVRSGERLRIDPEEVFGEPGEYAFFCKFHVDRGMTGVLAIVAAG
jgi:hypothetical protein